MIEIIDFYYWISLLAIAAVGGVMRGFGGFGSTMFMVPLLSLLMPPSEAVFIALTTDVLVMVPIFPKASVQARWRPIMLVLIGGFIVTPFGAWILLVSSPETMHIIIALAVIASACLLLSGWSFKGKQSHWLSLLVGLFAGTTNTAVGIGGPPIAVYFIAGGMSAATVRASLNVVGFIMEGVSATVIYASGGYSINILFTIGVLFPVMLLFAFFGSVMFRHVSNELFKKCILYFLILFAIYTLFLVLFG